MFFVLRDTERVSAGQFDIPFLIGQMNNEIALDALHNFVGTAVPAVHWGPLPGEQGAHREYELVGPEINLGAFIILHENKCVLF